MKDSVKLVMIDFQNILEVINKETTPRSAPYFVEILKKLEEPTPIHLDV